MAIDVCTKIIPLNLCLKAMGHNSKGEAYETTYPSGHSGVTQMRSIGFLTVRAPAEAGQHHDEGDHVEDGGHHREDQLHLQEGEGKLHLDEVPHLQQVEEGPEDGDDEAGDDYEEEEVVVADSKCWAQSVQRD